MGTIPVVVVIRQEDSLLFQKSQSFLQNLSSERDADSALRNTRGTEVAAATAAARTQQVRGSSSSLSAF